MIFCVIFCGACLAACVGIGVRSIGLAKKGTRDVDLDLKNFADRIANCGSESLRAYSAAQDALSKAMEAKKAADAALTRLDSLPAPRPPKKPKPPDQTPDATTT